MRRRSAWDAVEVTALILTGYACHLYYNLIGHISSLRGVDFGPHLLTPIDRLIPYMPVWVHAYQLAYFMPGAVLALLLIRLGADAPAVRRILLAFLSLLFLHYALYLLLPTSARAIRLPDDTLGSGILGSLVRYQYRLATVWCAWPSFHASACWLFCRLLGRHFRRASWVYLVWYVAMLIGTVSIKIHYVMDAATGLLLGEAAYRLVFVRLERSSSLSWTWRSNGARVAIHGVTVLVLLAGIPLLMWASGFQGPLYAVAIAR